MLPNKFLMSIRETKLGRFLRESRKRLRIVLHDSPSAAATFLRKQANNWNLSRGRHIEFPHEVHVETTSACNASCTMCPHEEMVRAAELIDDGVFQRIADECAENNCHQLWTFLIGEPLLDKKIVERIRYAKERGVRRVGFFTNASLLRGKFAENIIESGIDNITISIDGHSKEIFESIRLGLSHEEVTQNIRDFMKLRKSMGRTAPEVSMEFVRMDENRHEVKDFIRTWTDVVDAVYITASVNWAGGLDVGDNGNGRWEKYHQRKPCFRLWQNFIVQADSRAVLCCNDYNARQVIGDMKTQSIKDVWNGARMQEIRDHHLNENYGKVDICENCDAWRSPYEPWWF